VPTVGATGGNTPIAAVSVTTRTPGWHPVRRNSREFAFGNHPARWVL